MDVLYCCRSMLSTCWCILFAFDLRCAVIYVLPEPHAVIYVLPEPHAATRTLAEFHANNYTQLEVCAAGRYMLLSWLPKYLSSNFDLDLKSSGLMLLPVYAVPFFSRCTTLPPLLHSMVHCAWLARLQHIIVWCTVRCSAVYCIMLCYALAILCYVLCVLSVLLC